MKKYLLLFLAACILTACNETPKQHSDKKSAIVNRAEIEPYLKAEAQDLAVFTAQLDSLRSRVDENPIGILRLAALASKLEEGFDMYGDVSMLNESVRFRESVTQNTAIKPELSKRILAQSYIKQHKFKKADSLMKSFTGDYASRASKLIMFDIHMELGEYDAAQDLLTEIRKERDYNYHIRAAKWNDYLGRLDNTIDHMETALELADGSGNQAYQLWTYSNIADYYGHNGDIEKSYRHFLKTLELDPGNTYALRGISWIAYSNDENPELALEILNGLYKRHPSPDYLLLMAEVYEWTGNPDKATELSKEFLKRISNPAYGNMYNTYRIEKLLEGSRREKLEALEIAKSEIKNRATPEIYDLVAYSYLKTGDASRALNIYEKFVKGKTHEPVAALHSAIILKANGDMDNVTTYKNDLLEARYELGPVTYKEVESL
ncbi:MAG: hypothetical protein WBA16_00065 [Nonlabens sp.]